MRVPGLESRMSSGAVNTLPVTSSVWTESPGAEQNCACVTRGEDIRVEIITRGEEMLSSVSCNIIHHYPGLVLGLANPYTGGEAGSRLHKMLDNIFFPKLCENGMVLSILPSFTFYHKYKQYNIIIPFHQFVIYMKNESII